MFRIIVLFLCLLAMPLYAFPMDDNVLYEHNSLYQYIIVSENEYKGMRYLHNNDQHLIQGAMRLNSPSQLALEYCRMSLISLVFLDNEPKDVLVIGLGIGAIPKYLNARFPTLTVDVAEIDPEILDVARKYFYFKENEKMKVHINDGRTFIKRTKKRYDIVVLDAYRNGTIPFHLTTREFMAEIKKILKPGGVVVSNILSDTINQFHDSMIVTYQDAFEQLYIFTGKESRNYVFVATDQKKSKMSREVMERAKKVEKGLDVNLSLIAEGYSYGSVLRDLKADILTDDFAPVDILKQRKSKRL